MRTARPGSTGLWAARTVDVSVDGGGSRQEQDWKHYTLAHAAVQPGELPFHLCDSAAATFAAAESARFRPGSPNLAFNTAVSFTTNTNWQSYGGESTMSYFSQMVGLVIHNFVSAAAGIALAAALVRGIARHSRNARQLLGGSGARHLLPAAADLPGVRGVPRLARDDSKLQALHESQSWPSL